MMHQFTMGQIRFPRIWTTNRHCMCIQVDLRAEVDESKGILLPMHGILLFSKENEHPRMDFGAQNEWVWASNGHCMCIQVGFEG